MNIFQCLFCGLLLLNLTILESAEIPLQTARLPKCGSLLKDYPAIKISIPPDAPWRKSMNSAVIELPVGKMRGKRIHLSGEAMAGHLTLHEREQPYFGFKFMLTLRRKNGNVQYLDSGTNTQESFSWRSVFIETDIPADAVHAELHLGLQNVSGQVLFRNLKWDSAENFYAASLSIPPGFRCFYTPDVANRPIRRGVMSPPVQSCSVQDLEELASWGANLIRWQLWTPQEFTNADQITDWYMQRLDELEKLLPHLERLGIFAVIDMHLPPGGRTENQQFRMFDEKKYLDIFVNIWELIAHRLKGKKMIHGYDLCNEPCQKQPVKYKNYIDCQAAAAQAIRKIDPQTPVIIETNNLCGPESFSYLKPLPLKNIIYQFHMYHPLEYTHQGVHGKPRGISYPDCVPGGIRKILEPIREFQQKYGAVIYCGEFSAVRWADGAEQYLRDVIEIFEKYNWSWTYHAYREWHGWSVEHSNDFHDMNKTVSDTDRKKVLIKFFQKNTRPDSDYN